MGSPDSFPVSGSILAGFSEPFDGLKGEESESQETGLCLICTTVPKAESTERFDIPSMAAMRHPFLKIDRYEKSYRSIPINGLSRVMFVDGSPLK